MTERNEGSYDEWNLKKIREKENINYMYLNQTIWREKRIFLRIKWWKGDKMEEGTYLERLCKIRALRQR